MHKVLDIILENDKKVIGYEIDLSDQRKLIILKAQKGYIACGYINKEVSESFDDVAVFVKGVKNFDDVLNTKVFDLTLKAKELGIFVGEEIKTAIQKLF